MARALVGLFLTVSLLLPAQLGTEGAIAQESGVAGGLPETAIAQIEALVVRAEKANVRVGDVVRSVRLDSQRYLSLEHFHQKFFGRISCWFGRRFFFVLLTR